MIQRYQLQKKELYALWEEEKNRKSADLENLLKLSNEFTDIEQNLGEISNKFDEWRDFQWPEEQESEFTRFGMISSLSTPSFPLGLIKDPALLAAIRARHEELLQLRRAMAAEAERLKAVSAALEELERVQREAELARLARQARDWVFDPVPVGAAEFGANPVFRSDFTVDPVEARAAAASRKASRAQSRDHSAAPQPVESLPVARGYEDSLLGYSARSRQQSLDRRPDTGAQQERQPRQTGTNEDRGRNTEKLDKTKKPPSAPRRKK